MTNKKLLKNLLATASTVAVLASGVSAFAANNATVNANAALNLAAGFNNGSGVGGILGAGDSLAWTAPATVNFNAHLVLGDLDVAGFAATINVNDDNTIGNVKNTGAGAGGSLNVNFGAAHTLTLAGTNYTQLPTAAAQVIDFKNQANSKVVFATDNTTFTGKILNTGAGAGGNGAAVEISGNTTFINAQIGVAGGAGDNVAAINVDAGKTLTLTTTNATGLVLTTLNGNANLKVGSGSAIGAVAGGAGNVSVVAGAAAATIGTVTMGGAGNVYVRGGAVAATTNKLTMNAAGTIAVAGSATIDSIITANAASTVLLDATAATAAVTAVGTNVGAGAATAGNITVTNVVTLANGSNLTTTGVAGGTVAINGLLTVGAGSTATLNGYTTLGGAATVLTGNLTTSGANVALTNGVAFQANNSTLTLNSANTTVGALTANAANNGDVEVQAAATVGTIGAIAGNAVAKVNFVNDVVLSVNAAAGGNITTITANAASVNGTGTYKLASNQNLKIGTVGVAGSGIKALDYANNAATITITGTEFHVAQVLATGAGAGVPNVLAFNGNVTLDANTVIGTTTDRFGTVTVNGQATGAGVTNLGNSLVNVNKLNVTGGSKVTFTGYGSGPSMNLDSDGNGANVVTITNAKPITLATVGTTGAIATLNIDGPGGVTVASGAGAANSQITKLVFTTNAANATFTLDTLANTTTVTTASATGGGTVAFAVGATLGADFGAKANSMTALTYVPVAATTPGTAALAGNNTWGALVTAANADTLTVTGAGGAGPTTYGGFGTAGARLLAVNFIGGGVAANGVTVTGGTFAKSVTISAGTTVNFGGTVNGVDSTSTGLVFGVAGVAPTANDTAVFADGANILNMDIKSTANAGTVTFAGSSSVGKIGTAANTVSTVAFNGVASKVVNLGGSIYATNAAGSIALGAAIFNVTAPITLSGQTVAKISTLNLANNKVIIANGGLTLNGATTISTTYLNGTLGSLLGSSQALTLDPTPNVTITMNGYAPVGTVVTFSDLQGSGKLATAAKFSSTGNFTAWTLSTPDANHTVATASVNPGFVSNLQKNGVSEKGLALAKALASSSTPLTGTANALANLLDVSTSDKEAEAVNRLTASPDTSDAAHALAHQVNASIGGRMSATANPAGIAGGDDAGLGLGVWVSGFGAMSTQKANKSNSGYKGTVAGGTIGADAQVTENTSLGLGITYAGSTLKFKSTKSGDKATSTNMFFNLYGRQVIAEDWFVQGNAGFGTGTVKTGAKRVTGAASYDKASAKYDTMAISLEALAGYTYKVAEGVAVVPAAGLRYVNVNEGGYTESGSQFNTTVTKKASDKITGILGTTVASTYDMGGTTIAPEVHAFLEYDFKSKTPKVTAKIDGLASAFDVTGGKQAKFSANVGTSLTAKTDMLEYGLGYDGTFASKYTAHQGTLRLKVSL